MAFKKAAVLLLALLCVQYGAAMERRTTTHVHTSDARTEAFAAAMFDFVHSQYSFAHLLSEFTTCVVTPAKTFAQDPSSSAWRFAVTRGASEEDKASLLTKMAAFTTTQQQPYTDLIRSFSTVSVISSRLSSLVNSLLDGLATAFAVSQIMTEAKTEDRLTVPTENNPKVAEGMKEFAESIKKDPAAARTTFSKTIKFSILLEFLLPALDQFWSLLPYLGQFTIDTTVNQDLINSIFYNPKTTQFQWPKWLALLGFVSERDSDSRTCYQPLTGSSETAADMESIFRKLNAYAKTTVDTLTGAAKDVQESTEVLVKDNFLQFIAKLDQVSNEVTKFTEDMLHKWNAELNEDVKLLKYMLDERNCQSKNPETCDSICRKSLASCQQRRAQYELAQKLLNRNDICLMAADFNVQQNPAETTATTAKLVGKAKDKSTHVLFVLNGYLIHAKPQRPQGSKYTVQGWSVRNVFNILRDGNLRIDFDEQADGSSLMKLMAFDHLIESFTLSKDRSEHFVESIKSINRVTGDDAFSLCLSSNNLRDAKMLQPFADAISDQLRYKAEEAIGLRTRVFDQSQRSDVKRKGMSKANKKSGMQPAFTNQAACEAAMLDQQSSSTVSSSQWCKEVSGFNPALCDIMTCVAEQNEKAVQLLLGPTYTRQSIEQSLDSLHHTSVVRQYTPPSITPPATAVCDTIDSFQALIQAEPRFNRINKCISCVFAVSNRYVFVPYHEGAVDLEGEIIQHEAEQSQTPKTAPVKTATEAETDETDTSTEVSQPVTETTEETSKKKKTTTAAKKKEKKKRAAARKKASAEHPTAEPKTEPKTEQPKTEHEEEDDFLLLLETQDLTRTRAHHFCTVVLQLRGENHRKCVRFIEGKATTTTTTTVDASTTATAAAADRFQPLVDIIKSFKEELESVQDQTKEALSICQQVDLCPTSCDFADFESPPPKTLSFSQDLTEEISKKTEEGIEQALQLGKQAQTEAQTDKSKPTIEAQSATPSESPKSEEEDD
eukprot:GILK01002609.1.p1 GENE.GILK01002609.1~~GILK01002609.1.p1  ORF type:complete len:1004 (-),score=221.57 GILK01002609.1:285-3296(-)